ncbi:LysR family transcriptional regulator [Polyangium aurulentum]|uniref:LysR family transcriptional regulator n=1 Tax=Polyangium aurulentum TaxID=2567896 RepID=UPI0010ADEF87|nr:LysR family transcriptional regulator [Polyangium aurulentum]UQA59286.1 LysR family transcriptional regulator [Polyangium aurulentum]
MAPPNLSGIDLNLLVACEVLLSERSVTRAAERLGVTQSAASHALGRLRELFGDPLLVRARSGMVLTPHAEALAPALRESLAGLAQVLGRGQRFDPAEARRRFSMSTSDYAQILVLPALIERLSATAPGIDVAIRGPTFGPARALEAGELDLVIGPITEDLPGIRALSGIEDGFVCVVRRGHPALGGGALTLEHYLALGHVLIAPRGIRPSPVDLALSAIGKARRVVVEVPSFMVAPELVACSDFVLTLPSRLAARFAPALGLEVHAPPIKVEGFSFRVYWHERSQHDAGHAWFRTLVHEVCRGLGPPPGVWPG